jgi:uncharacterized membrane protein YphA (DoxX/SURF4 family)
MLDRLSNYVDAPARALMAAIFIPSGIGKLSAFEGTQAYMEAFGLPGLLILARAGAPGLSVDQFLATRYGARG